MKQSTLQLRFGLQVFNIYSVLNRHIVCVFSVYSFIHQNTHWQAENININSNIQNKDINKLINSPIFIQQQPLEPK